ncbi:MAG: hypothetical protein Q7N87_03505 [Candidatus Uhrbacteria bacterium]|nr:hypothetical protein [Candidatus Uhrbacteria bacterium]
MEKYFAEHAAHQARCCAEFFRDRYGIKGSTSLGLVLGTGWGDALTLDDERSLPLSDINGFHGLADLPSHARRLVYGLHAGKPVIALRGRVHMNEAFSTPRAPHMVRLQIEMLIALGVRDLVLTAAVGSLDERIMVGDVVIVNGLVTLFAPPRPLHTGEFCSPEDVLDRQWRDAAGKVAETVGLRSHAGAHAMVSGPDFESRRHDKKLLGMCGASVIGMSILPELAVFAATCSDPKRRALAVTFVTNTASEQHSHEVHQARARESGAKLGAFLSGIIKGVGTETETAKP